MHLYNSKRNVSIDPVCFQDGIKWIRIEEYGSYQYQNTLDEFTSFMKVDILKCRANNSTRRFNGNLAQRKNE